ncbi:hypothetical protein F5883DRAFT_203267 [Diaporthe sp. PMI_573]|nr:hypothetical protein F5883DRAFT_203267 [Diaporthaceae sp. PMI_573]
MKELLTVWLAQRKGLLCVGPSFAHARVPAVAPVPCTCSSFPCRLSALYSSSFLSAGGEEGGVVTLSRSGPGSSSPRALGSWLLAPGFFFSPRRLPSTHSTSFCATRYDTTRQDAVKTSSSRLLPCCTPFPSPPPLLSFVLSLSLPCYFLVSFSGPTSARPSIVSGDPSRRKLSLLTTTTTTPCSVPPGNTTASRSRKTTPPPINKNSASPPPIPTRLLSPPPGTLPDPIQYDLLGRQLLFLSVPSFVRVFTEHFLHWLHSARCEPITSACLACLSLASHLLQTKACILRQSAPSERPSEPTTTAANPPPATISLVLGPNQAHDASDSTEAPHVLVLAKHHRVHAWDS